MPIHGKIIRIVRVTIIHTVRILTADLKLLPTVGGAQVPTVHGTAIRHGAGAVLIPGIQAQPTGAATGKDGEKYGYKRKKDSCTFHTLPHHKR